MRKLWVIAILVLLWPAQAQATEQKDWIMDVFGCNASPCYIRESTGGLVERFTSAATQVLERHMQVRIDGECTSACAIFASMARANVCLTKNAEIGVHMGYTFTLIDPQGKIVDPDITTGRNVDIFEHPPDGYIRKGQEAELDYGEDLNRWTKELGKMPSNDDVYFLTWDEAMLFWRACE